MVKIKSINMHMNHDELVKLANKIRVHSIRMANNGKSSHVASALSIADILAVLYGSFLHFDVNNPAYVLRDRFILSKGHAGAAVYATLAEIGFFDKERLLTHYQNGSTLSGHVSHKGIPGIEISTGSLGHGLGVGAGMAYACKNTNTKSRIVVIMSDGECDEGSVWEAALFASYHKLSNMIAIIDYNKLQGIGRVSQSLALEPFGKKWDSFNWNVSEVDGHNIQELDDVLSRINQDNEDLNLIIAHTIKGKGVSFMEDNVLWHYRWPRDNELEQAELELNKNNAI